MALLLLKVESTVAGGALGLDPNEEKMEEDEAADDEVFVVVAAEAGGR